MVSFEWTKYVYDPHTTFYPTATKRLEPKTLLLIHTTQLQPLDQPCV